MTPDPRMKRFLITYQDVGDPTARFTAVWRGHNPDHAADRFYSAPDADVWEIVKIEPARPPLDQR